MPGTRLAVHPMVVAVALGLLAPQSLTELVDGTEPELGLDDTLDFDPLDRLEFAADDGLRFEADVPMVALGDVAVPVHQVDPAEVARVELLWNSKA